MEHFDNNENIANANLNNAENLNNPAAPVAEDLNIQQENAAAEQEDNNELNIIEARWESQQAPEHCANCIHYGVWDDINVQLTVPCMNCAREHNWIWRNLPCYGTYDGETEATGNVLIVHSMLLFIVERGMSLENVKPLLPLELQGQFHQAYLDYTSIG